MIAWSILMKGLLLAYGCPGRMDRQVIQFLLGVFGERGKGTEARMCPQSIKQLLRGNNDFLVP